MPMQVKLDAFRIVQTNGMSLTDKQAKVTFIERARIFNKPGSMKHIQSFSDLIWSHQKVDIVHGPGSNIAAEMPYDS